MEKSHMSANPDRGTAGVPSTLDRTRLDSIESMLRSKKNLESFSIQFKSLQARISLLNELRQENT